MDAISNLLQACAKGEVSAIQHLLDQGLSVDSFNEEEVTPLQIASAFGQEQVVCLLLTRGAALDASNSFGWTPLMHACRYGHTKSISLLLQNKANVTVTNKLGASALTMAICSGQINIVRMMLDAGASVNGDELTPLMAAAKNGFEQIVKLLLDRGVDVNHQAPSSGFSALMYAAANGHKTTTQILYERGANANVSNACDKTAFDMAQQKGKVAVAEFLAGKTKSREDAGGEQMINNVLEATKKGDFELVRDLLAEDPNQRDIPQAEDGATPLMFSAIMGRLDMTELFVNMGANMNTKDTVNGWTALMQAIFHGKNDVARYLIQAGADVNVHAFNGCTAFDLASLVEDVDINVIRLVASKLPQHPDDGGKENITKDDHYAKGARRWWDRMSNHLRHFKRGRTTSRLEKLPVVQISELTTRPVRSLSDSSCMLSRSPTETGIGRHERSPSNPASPFNLALPTPMLNSDNLKPVVPPPLPSFNVGGCSQRHLMPRGRIHSPKSAHLITPVAPLWATRWFSSSTENSFISPNSSMDMSQHGASSEKSSPVKFVPMSKLTSPMTRPVTIHVTSYAHRNEDGEDKVSEKVLKEFLNNSSSRSSSKSSKSSTLTPTPSEVEEKSCESDPELLGSTLQALAENDEVAAILKKLALEKYQPIFEEQEVDVEALLSLTETDLVDLGIQPTESRQQLLNVIDGMNNSKQPFDVNSSTNQT